MQRVHRLGSSEQHQMADPNRHPDVWGIIPAAGLSRRMGRPKQSLPYHGSTITAAVARTLLDADVSGVVVVTRSELLGDLHLPPDPRVQTAINDDSESEMIDSIRIGLSAVATLAPADDDGILVVPGDMPTLTACSCRACMAAYAADPKRIVIATHEGRRGHPIVFPFAMREIVDGLRDGLRMLPDRYPERVFLINVDDPGVAQDVDTIRDYDRL